MGLDSIENVRIKSPRLEKATRDYWFALEQHFKSALENELEKQNHATIFSPVELAKALVSAVMGIHAQNRALGDQTGGSALVDIMCATLSELRAQS